MAEAFTRTIEALIIRYGVELTGSETASLLKFIENGDLDSAVDLILSRAPEVSAAAVTNAVLEEILGYAETTIEGILRLYSGRTWSGRLAVFNLDTSNPSLVSLARVFSANLIVQIEDSVRRNVSAIVARGIQQGLNPRDIARDVRQLVGLTEFQSQAVQNFRRELETFHLRRTAPGWGLGEQIDRAPGGAQVFRPGRDGLPLDGILRRRLRDYRYDRTLLRSMRENNPIPPSKIDQMVQAYVRKYRKYRSEVIARTEGRRIQQLAAQESWRQIEQSGTLPSGGEVRRYWLTARDERVRLTHRPIPRMNPRGVGMREPFHTPEGYHMLPPIAPNCRCIVVHRFLEPGMDPAKFAPQ